RQVPLLRPLPRIRSVVGGGPVPNRRPAIRRVMTAEARIVGTWRGRNDQEAGRRQDVRWGSSHGYSHFWRRTVAPVPPRDAEGARFFYHLNGFRVKSKSLRITAATAMAAIAFGVAAPAASAAETPQAPVAHNRAVAPLELTPTHARMVLRTPEVANHLSAQERAQVQALADAEGPQSLQRGLGGSLAKAAWAALKKAGPAAYNGAKSAAGKGAQSLKNWAKNLSWKDPIRWTVGQLSVSALEELIRYLLG
ncbi:hypothetical protein ACFXPI_12315, partial [Streptomyces sp. NPDC059104]|uniref:hypothetical protein n=1 Tax=Streptomyces sp. NPDC059104 TaxID=3346729 RepID=UPI0036D10EE9